MLNIITAIVAAIYMNLGISVSLVYTNTFLYLCIEIKRGLLLLKNRNKI